jgi:hypothetical protein
MPPNTTPIFCSIPPSPAGSWVEMDQLTEWTNTEKREFSKVAKIFTFVKKTETIILRSKFPV